MMRWIYKLEDKLGRRYVSNLMLYVIGGMVIAYLANMIIGGSALGAISFWRDAIFQGQVWRVLSFIFVPPGGQLLPPLPGLAQVNSTLNPVFILLSMFFIYTAGKTLEQMWGAPRLNLYYFIGIIFAIIGGFVSPMGFGTNTYLNSSLFLALATIMPEMEFRLYLVIPIKGYWFAILFFAYDIFMIVRAFLTFPLLGWNNLILFAFSMVNYLLFFGPTLMGALRQQMIVRRNRRNWRNSNNNWKN